MSDSHYVFYGILENVILNMQEMEDEQEKSPIKGLVENGKIDLETRKRENTKKSREAGMMLAIGGQGVGKTYNSNYVIKDYVKDKIDSKVKGRKCLIFDTNSEYGEGQFAANGIPNFKVRTLRISDVEAWGRSEVIECRRIDAKNLSIDEKIQCVEHMVKVFRNGLLVLDDLNTYILSVTHMASIVSGLVNLRHRAVDVLVSYQSLRAVEPRMFANCRWVRLHYQSDNVYDVKSKLPNVELFKIAQLIIETKYFAGDKRFYLFVMKAENKLIGKFKKSDFEDACRKYLNINKKLTKEYAEMNGIDKDGALKAKVQHLVDQYYGNEQLKPKSAEAIRDSKSVEKPSNYPVNNKI